MECPYLENHAAEAICGASVGLVAPDQDDKTAYCSTEEHYRCPMLLGRILRAHARKAA